MDSARSFLVSDASSKGVELPFYLKSIKLQNRKKHSPTSTRKKHPKPLQVKQTQQLKPSFVVQPPQQAGTPSEFPLSSKPSEPERLQVNQQNQTIPESLNDFLNEEAIAFSLFESMLQQQQQQRQAQP